MRSLLPMLLSLCALSLAGCPASAPAELADCPDGSTVTWATVEPIFASNCTRCHDSAMTGGDRQSAPENWDYDSRDAALRDPDETWRRIYIENMPNDDAFTSEADKLLVWEWYSCDGPQ